MNRSLLAIVLCAAAAAATAQTTATVTPDTWDAYRGTRIVEANLATEEACIEAAKALGTGNYTCRTQTRVVVSAAPPPPPPPTGVTWTQCASQEEILCGPPVGAYSGTRVVRFGSDTRWVERDLPSGRACNSTTFGTNPAPGALKTCQVRTSTTTEPPPPPVATGSALLQWAAPSRNDDGSPLTDLTGYRIRYGRSATALDQMLEIAPTTTFRVQSLASGDWYFTVSAVRTGGVESIPSNTATKVIP